MPIVRAATYRDLTLLRHGVAARRARTMETVNADGKIAKCAFFRDSSSTRHGVLARRMRSADGSAFGSTGRKINVYRAYRDAYGVLRWRSGNFPIITCASVVLPQFIRIEYPTSIVFDPTGVGDNLTCRLVRRIQYQGPTGAAIVLNYDSDRVLTFDACNEVLGTAVWNMVYPGQPFAFDETSVGMQTWPYFTTPNFGINFFSNQIGTLGSPVDGPIALADGYWTERHACPDDVVGWGPIFDFCGFPGYRLSDGLDDYVTTGRATVLDPDPTIYSFGHLVSFPLTWNVADSQPDYNDIVPWSVLTAHLPGGHYLSVEHIPDNWTVDFY